MSMNEEKIDNGRRKDSNDFERKEIKNGFCESNRTSAGRTEFRKAII